MSLKAIELQGFKSFADKTVFEFSRGVSAIVGPNGSGKSNVVDAIRWVLGEQSAKTLRGGKMEDVIFSGSSTRKPVGMAKVTLRLDNSLRIFPIDFDEVAVSRILHRSGESQYEINKRTCRLKDIQELFMDTGLGRDGFSIIGQGKIDEILTLHAEDRRGLLEEAAGISKYKYRKREAERRLNATSDDIEHLEDILYELVQRLGPLKEQAEKVRNYRVLEKEEDALSLAWHVSRLEDLQALEQSQEKAKEEQEKIFQEIVAAHQKAEADYREIRFKLVDLQQRDEAQATQLMNAIEQLERLDKEESLLNERMKSLQERMNDSDERRQHQETYLHEFETTILEMQNVLEIINDDVIQLREDVREKEAAVNEARATQTGQQEALKVLSERQFSLLREQADRRNALTKAKQQRETALVQQSRRTEEYKSMLMEWDDWQNKQSALEEGLAEKEKNLKKQEDEFLQCEQILQQHQDQRQCLRKNVDQLKGDRLHAKSRLEVLDELEASGEGYYAGVQAVLRATHQAQLKGISGTVSQLLEISEKMMAAIESALGGAAQYLVSEKDTDAQKAIEWLKRERRGRATFLPLNTIKGKRLSDYPRDESVIGLAVDLVDYDDHLQPVMEYLLGRIVVVDCLENGMKLAKKEGFKHRYVTLEGDVISPGGSLTGGRQKQDHSVVRRASERQTLKTKITRFDDSLATMEKELEKLEKDYQEAISKRQVLSDELQRERMELQKWQLLIDGGRQEGERLKRLNQLLMAEQKSLKEDISINEEEIKRCENKLGYLDKALQRCEEERQEREIAQSEQSTSDQEQEQAWQDSRIRLVQLEENLRAQEDQLKAEKRREQETKDMLQQIVEGIHMDKQRLVAYETEAESLRQQKEAAREILHGERAERERVKETLLMSQSEEIRLSEEVRRLQDERHTEERLLEKRQGQFQRTLEKSQQLKAELLNERGLTFEEARELADRTIDLQHAAERLGKLKKDKLAFGALNFTAPEEFEEVQERSSFMQKQLDDLVIAKQRLEKIITEIEKTMTERFAEAYDKVNRMFNDIFQQMFMGGHARLELSMPKNLLETGVEIVAQPPGKKERTLTLLSGGERAMTAIALLFALLNVRPSPFVILDEIEAALDSANVDRFANFIGNYAKNTQFIVISHRQGTMEAADVLYGVTMDGAGSSRLVSVRIEDYISEEV